MIKQRSLKLLEGRCERKLENEMENDDFYKFDEDNIL